MPIFRTLALALALALSFGSARASVVSYEFSSGTMFSSSGSTTIVRIGISIDQSLLPANLPLSTLQFWMAGIGELNDASLETRAGTFSLSSFEPGAITVTDATSGYCTPFGCHFSLRFNRQGDIDRFRILMDAGSEYVAMATYNTFAPPPPEDFGDFKRIGTRMVFSYNRASYNTNKRPSVQRTGDVVGTIPVPLPASGALLLLPFLALGGVAWRRSRCRQAAC